MGDIFIKGTGVLIGELFRKGFGDMSARARARAINRVLKRNVKHVNHTLKNTSKVKKISNKKYLNFKSFIKGY